MKCWSCCTFLFPLFKKNRQNPHNILSVFSLTKYAAILLCWIFTYFVFYSWLVFSCLNLKSKHRSLKIPKLTQIQHWNPALDFSLLFPKLCLLLLLLFFPVPPSMFMDIVFVLLFLLPVSHTQDMYIVFRVFLAKCWHPAVFSVSTVLWNTVQSSGIPFLSLSFLSVWLKLQSCSILCFFFS